MHIHAQDGTCFQGSSCVINNLCASADVPKTCSSLNSHTRLVPEVSQSPEAPHEKISNFTAEINMPGTKTDLVSAANKHFVSDDS